MGTYDRRPRTAADTAARLLAGRSSAPTAFRLRTGLRTRALAQIVGPARAAHRRGRLAAVDGDAHRAYEYWRTSYPEAVEELERIQACGADPQDVQAWRREHPEAAQMFGRIILNSEDVVRKMRMTEPTWEPPDVSP